jgi:thiamine pyrophosphate-dependent acetolactate synthase large subunit-like protein
MKVLQKEFISNLCEKNPDAVIVSSLGTISYDLKECDHNNKILVKGAMGHAIPVALGHALGDPNRDVIVVIGDGSYLMKMGSTATVLKYSPPNLRVIILNNNLFKSCGGQETNFACIDAPFETYEVI